MDTQMCADSTAEVGSPHLDGYLRWDALGCYCHIRYVNYSIFIPFLDTTDEYLVITNFVAPLSKSIVETSIFFTVEGLQPVVGRSNTTDRKSVV